MSAATPTKCRCGCGGDAVVLWSAPADEYDPATVDEPSCLMALEYVRDAVASEGGGPITWRYIDGRRTP